MLLHSSFFQVLLQQAVRNVKRRLCNPLKSVTSDELPGRRQRRAQTRLTTPIFLRIKLKSIIGACPDTHFGLSLLSCIFVRICYQWVIPVEPSSVLHGFALLCLVVLVFLVF